MELQVVFDMPAHVKHRLRYDVANHHGWFPERCIKKRNSPLRPRPSPLPAGTPVPPKPPLLTTKAPRGLVVVGGWWGPNRAFRFRCWGLGLGPRVPTVAVKTATWSPVEVADVDTFARTATPPPDDEVPLDG